jgi:hypothetical protein
MSNLIGMLIHKCRNAVHEALVARGIVSPTRDDMKIVEERAAYTSHTVSHGSCSYENSTLEHMKGVEIAPDVNANSFSAKRMD